MDVVFHGKSDQRITLIDVAYVPDLGFNLYSLHAVQRTHLIVSDASETHIIGTNLTFPRSSSGSYLRATRLPASTVGARQRQGNMRATNLLRQLGHPIPPPSQEPPPPPRKNMCATGLYNSNVPGVVTVLEPTPFPPLSSVLGEIQFVGKTPSRPACRIGIPLAAAALIPGPLKHGKEVDINHLHVSLNPRPWECAEIDSETAWDPLDRGTSFMFGLFSSEGTSSTYPTSRDEASDAHAGTCPHRHRWALPNFSWGVAVRCDVRRQRFASTAAIRRAREERGRHSFCRETLRGRYGGPTRVPH